MKVTLHWVAIATNAICITLGHAFAAQGLTLFNQRTLWENTVSGIDMVTERFDSVPDQLLSDGAVLSLPSGLILTAQSPDSFVAGSITGGLDAFADSQILLGDFDPGDALILSFSEPVIGVGFDYLDIDLGGVRLVGRFEGSAELGSLEIPFSADGSNTEADFFGLVADQPFSELVLTLANGPSETWDLDNLSLATNTPVAVPEPSFALALLGVALGSGLVVKRSSSPAGCSPQSADPSTLRHPSANCS